MKKLLLCLMLSTVAIFTTACGGGETKEETPAPVEKKEEPTSSLTEDLKSDLEKDAEDMGHSTEEHQNMEHSGH